MTYDFTLILRGVAELDDELADKLFEAGCDDATPSSSNGKVSVDFSRDAADLESAIRAAIANVTAAGCTVERVEIAPDAAMLKG